MKYISSKTPTTWKFSGTIQNPANIGSRGTNIRNLPKEWWDGPRWLAYPDCWPKQKNNIKTKEPEKQAKTIKEVICI